MPCQVQRCKKKRIFFYPINANPVAKVREKTDLSHEVHADNCTVSGSFCDPSPPAYSYRSVSALLYLSSLHKQVIMMMMVIMVVMTMILMREVFIPMSTSSACKSYSLSFHRAELVVTLLLI